MSFQKFLMGVCCLLPGLGWADDDIEGSVMGASALVAACAQAPQEDAMVSHMKMLDFSPEARAILLEREKHWLTLPHLMPLKQLLSRFGTTPLAQEGFLQTLEEDALTPHELSLLACLTLGDDERHLFVKQFRALGQERIVSLHQLVVHNGSPPFKRIPLAILEACLEAARDVSPIVLNAFMSSSVATQALPSALRLLAFCESTQDARVISHFFAPLLWLYPAYDALGIAKDLTQEHITWAKTNFPKDKDGHNAWHLALAARDKIPDEKVGEIRVLFQTHTLEDIKGRLFEREVCLAPGCLVPTSCAAF